MDTFTIQSFNDDGSVSVLFSIDNKVQTLSGVPVFDPDETTMYLAQYCQDYRNGFDAVAASIPETTVEVEKLSGQEFSVDYSSAEPEVEAT